MADNADDLITQKDKAKEEEDAIKNYRNYLESLVKDASPDIFLNKGTAHASVLMATLLKNTHKSVKMYCAGLRPGILCGKEEGANGDEKKVGFQGVYWTEFKRLFEKRIEDSSFGKNSVKSLIQSDEYLQNMPFKKIKESAARNNEIKNKIEVKRITDSDRAYVKYVLSSIKCNGDYNFSVFDNTMFRLEYDIDQYKAIGSFNDPSWCKILNALFDVVYESATLVSLA